MPRFYFNLVGPYATGPDRQGADCATLEAACREVRKAIVHISLRILEDRGRPELMSFDILDDAQKRLKQVAFAEVLRGVQHNVVPASKWFDREILRDQILRSLELQRDVAADIAAAYRTVECLRAGGRLSN